MNDIGKSYWEGKVYLSSASKKYQSCKEINYPYNNSEIDLTIFVSCYNEEKFIKNTLETIKHVMQLIDISYEIIIIDDCSNDNSVEIVREFINQHKDLNVILRVNNFNKGLAQNFIDAAFIGKGKYYRLVCGDNSEPPETLIDIFKMLGQADIIVPFYISASGKSFKRRVISKVYTFIINTISGNKIKYYNGLQIHLRYNVMRWHPNTRGFGFQAGLLCLLIQMGFTYKQIPCITIEQRAESSNALTFKNLLSVIHTIASIFLRRISFKA